MTAAKPRWLLLWIVIALVLAGDQLTKRLIISNLTLGELRRPLPFLGDYFRITRSHNTGAAFGVLPQTGDIFLIVAIIVVAGLVVFYPRIARNSRVSQVAIGLVCGGALGNALDRIIYGHVIDFINYQIPGVISNVSNLADHAIVVGVLLLMVRSWREERVAKAGVAASEAPPSA